MKERVLLLLQVCGLMFKYYFLFFVLLFSNFLVFSKSCIFLEPVSGQTFSKSTNYFSIEEIRLIRKFSLNSTYDFDNYIWPTNTYSKKVNLFFLILNNKKFDSAYIKAYLKLLELCPELIHEDEGC